MATIFPNDPVKFQPVELPYRQLFESFPEMYLILSPELKILDANNIYLREAHKKREEVVGNYIFDVFPQHPDTAKADKNTDLMESFQLVLSSRKAHKMAILRYDILDQYNPGNLLERYWQATNSPILDQQGEVMYLIHKVENVTEKVLTVNQLEKAQQGEAAALAKVRNEKDRLDRFIMQAPAIIVIHSGPDLVFEKINPRYQQVFPGRQLLGKPLLEGLPELAGTPVWDMLQQVYQTGETVYGKEVLIPIAPSEGAPLENNYYNFIYQARQDEKDQVDGIMVFAYEVTDQVEARKQAERILDGMHQIVWTANAQGEPTYLNQHWYTYTGGSRSDLNNKSQANFQLATYMHPEDGLRQLKYWKEHLSSGNVFELEVRVKRASDGTYRWHLNRAVPIRNQTGEIILWIGTATDIHDHKLMESALQERELRLQAMFEQSIAGIVLADQNFKFTFANDRFCQMLGRTREEVLTLTIRDITHPDDFERNLGQLKNAKEKGEPFVIEKRYLKADGSVVWIVNNVSLVRDQKGTPLYYMGVCQDVTTRKMAEQSLQQLSKDLAEVNNELAAANEEILATNNDLETTNLHLARVNADLDNFIYTASHDLKAPIANIDGLMRLLERKLNQKGWQDDSIYGLTEMINHSIIRFKETIQDLTEVAKVQKQLSGEPERIKLEDVLNDILLDLRDQIGESEAIIQTYLESCPEILFSKKNLKSIVYNLLSNAIKYRHPGRASHIFISCQQEGEFQVLTIKDNGLGMDVSDDSKLFGMFKRFHTHVEGTGIGLYIVKKMIENAGGKIEVESKVGEGSTFKVYFKK